MVRTSPVHYIAPSSISITPNANGSASDLAVYIAKGSTIKVYSKGIADLGMRDSTWQQWTLTGRNRRLGDNTKPYTVYARLSKTNTSDGYLIFAQKEADGDNWKDKYAYVTMNGLATDTANKNNDAYWYIKLGDVSLPNNEERSVTLDTGILGTDQFNTEWNLDPDDMPLRVELSATIDDSDAGDKPYVPWGKELILRSKLVEGWADTNVERFHHWTIQRNTGDKETDLLWNFPDAGSDNSKPSSGRQMIGGNITLSHARGDGDVFNGSVSSIWTVTAWGRKEDTSTSSSSSSDSTSSTSSSSNSASNAPRDVEVYEPLAQAVINIMAETAEHYALELSTNVVNYDPSSDSYNPIAGVDAMVRATDQKGEVFKMTKAQVDNASLAIQYSVADNLWNTCDIVSDDITNVAKANIPIEAFHLQQNVNVRIVKVMPSSTSSNQSESDDKNFIEVFRIPIAFVRNGEDSKEREWIFLRSKSAIAFSSDSEDKNNPLQPALINLGEVNPEEAASGIDPNKNQDGWVPQGWWDEMQGTNETYHYEYAAYRDYIKNTDSSSSKNTASTSSSAESNENQGGGHWGDFTTARIWSYYAEDAVSYRCRWTLAGIEVYQLKCAYTGAFRGTLPLVATLMKRVGNGKEQMMNGKAVIDISCQGIDFSKTYNAEAPSIAIDKDSDETKDFIPYLNNVSLQGMSITFTIDGETHSFSIPVIREADEDSVKDTIDTYGSDLFLSKLNPDTAQKLITFLEGIAVGDGKYGVDGKGTATLAKVIADEIASEGYVDSVDQGIGKGFHLWQTGGTSNMQVDNLTVRGKWTAALLEVMKLQYSAGNITFDGAGGEIYAVVPYDADGKEVTDNAASAAYYRCYFKATDGDRHIQNEWHLGDQARCQTFNLTDGTYTNSANRSYFRVVRNVGKEVTQYNGVDCFYIDLSNLQNDSFQADTSVGDIHAGDIVRFRGIMHDKANDGTVTWAENDVPQKGDNIAHLGNVYDTDRQGAVQIIAVGETKGLIIYDGINETLDNLSRFAQIQWSPKSSFVNTQKFLFTNGHTANHPYIQCGEWEEGTTAHPSEVWQYEGASWVCNNETENAPSDTDSDWSVLAARGKTVEAYDVALSRYQGAVSVDSRGNIMGGLYTVSQNGVKQWLLSSTVYVRKGTDILLEEDEGSEEVTKGHYRVTAFSDDCTCEVHNSTVYITGIRNLIGGDDTDKDIDLVAMRDMAFCKVSIVLDLEGVASKTVEFSICVTHDGIDGITYDVDPTVETAAVAIQSSGDDISKNITVSGKLSVDCEYKVYKKTGDKRSGTPETDIKLSAAFDDGTTKGLTVSGMNVKGSNIDYSSTDSRKAVVVTFKKGSDTIAVRNVPITLNPATQITDDAKKYQLIKANGDNVSALQVTADGISAKVDKINSDLLATGIDITNKKIMLTADKTTFQTNDGKEIAVFDKDGIIAHKVTSVGDDGRKVVIEDGILSVFGTNGVANIRFGVDEAGNSILSYYDNNGNFLYDLGPTGLDNSRLKEARVITYTVRQITNKAIGAVSEMKDYPIYFTQTDANGTVQGQTQQDFSVATILEDYNAIFNGISMSKHTGTVENVTTIMQYYAGRMNGTIVADTNRNLTAEQAQKYDGKFFTAEVFDDAHLVSGRYCNNIIYDAANDIMSTYDASTGLTSSPSSGQYPCSYVLVTTYNNGVAGGVTQTVGNRGPAKIYSRMTYDVSKSTI